MNTRHFVFAIMTLTSGTIFAQPLAKPSPSAHPFQRRVITPEARSNMLAKTGGMVQSQASGPSILFLNTQKRVPIPSVNEPLETIQKLLRFPCEFKTLLSEKPVADAVNALSNTNIATVIVIGDVPDYPSLLVAPENRWALINVAALGDPKTSPELLAERTQKEIWRAFAYVMGAANSNFEHCLLKPVVSVIDLDALKAKSVCPEPLNKIMMHAQHIGMKPIRVTSYRKAVEEGWAPAPTNTFQRAIWDELKTKN